MVIFWKSPVALGVEKPLSTDSVLECLQYLDVEAVMLPPAILEDMSQEEASINALKKQKAVIFGGGKWQPCAVAVVSTLITFCLR